MNKLIASLILPVSLLNITGAGASEFGGSYFGLKAGGSRLASESSVVMNSSFADLPGVESKSNTAFSLEGGHNWDMKGYLLGTNLFFDSSKNIALPVAASGVQATANSGAAAYGLGLKLGLPTDNWLPYAKLGYGRGRISGGFDAGGNGAHAGAGIEYKLSFGLSLVGELTAQIADTGSGIKFRNNNFTIGLSVRPQMRP